MNRSWLLLAGCLLGGFGVLAATEIPSGDEQWRPHMLSRCAVHAPPLAASRADLEEARELFQLQNGGDAVFVLESALADHDDWPWLILLLAQIYLLAGQGEPHCQPTTGPVALTGEWSRDQHRLLGRADELLARLTEIWPDDGLVDFLRADVARAAGDQEAAAAHDHTGRRKCTHLESLGFVGRLRDLRPRTARVIAPIVPEYPEACARARIEGEIVLDLLIDPQGRAAQTVVVVGADRRLERAARAAVATGGYQAAQLGYYPVWSWLRVPIRFTLDN